MAINKRLLVKPPTTPGGITPSEHFGVVLYEGDGASSHSINGGKFGAAAYFDGSNGKIDISRSVLVGDDWTISMWVRVASGTPYTNFRFFDSSYGDYAGKLRLGINTNGTVNVAQGNATSAETSFNSTGTINDNAWHNLSVTFDGTTARLYIDGSADGTGTPSNYSDSSGDARIGGGNTISGSNPFKPCKGKIDQVRIFQKELSSSEVSTLYAETAATVESLDPLSEDTTDTLQVLGDTSCIATYRFENNEDDLSGNYNGTGTSIQYAAGRYGQAASFNGSDSYISTTLDLKDLSSVSISFWAYWQSGINGAVIGGDSSDGASGYKSNKNTVTLIYSSNRFDYLSYGGDLYRHTTSLSDGWHHFAISDNGGTGNTSATMYIDGVSVSYSIIVDGGSYSNHENMQIGRTRKNDGTIGNYYDNKLDQIRIFNKALSASEVTTLYEENSLVASYRFEGNANDDMRTYDGTASNVTYEYGLGFTPDFVWTKRRDLAADHNLVDSTRGIGPNSTLYAISPNLTGAQTDSANNVKSLDSGGFTVGGTGTRTNADGYDYVSWCLKANGGTTSSNTDGSITSTVQVNTQSGFSIVKYTGDGSTSATIGHNLSAAPEMVIVKNLSSADNWIVYNKYADSSPASGFLQLNQTAAFYVDSDAWGGGSGTEPTSTLVTIGDGGTDAYTNKSGSDYIAYCFHSVDSFSKFGTYTGNADDFGPIVETGFEPSFLMIKRTSATDNWVMIDNKRSPINPRNKFVWANKSDAESTFAGTREVNFYSNGFQPVSDGSDDINDNNATYIYMAFAADPDTEAPAVAKSFSTVTYTGNGTSQDIEGLGFSPSLVWLKSRSATGSGRNYNILTYEGPVADGSSTKYVSTNSSLAQASSTNTLTSLDSDGFRVYGTGGDTNSNGVDYVAWAWKADDNEPAINTEGSIDSLVSANANAGFSIVKYEGNGSAGATIGHNLSAAPEMVIIKNLDSAVDWRVGHTSAGWTKFGKLNKTDAFSTSSVAWNDTAPSSTVVTLGTSSGLNSSGVNYIAYCFHSVSGYSKFASYSGSSSAVTVTTGFKPDFVLIKNIDGVRRWVIFDSVRNDFGSYLDASDSLAEQTDSTIEISTTSTGFVLPAGANYTINSSGYDYIYWAIKIN